MSEKPSEPEKNGLPEDAERLYSQARAPEGQYLDFAASREQVQKRFRDRAPLTSTERKGVESAGPPEPLVQKQIRYSRFHFVPAEVGGRTMRSASSLPPETHMLPRIVKMRPAARPSVGAPAVSPSESVPSETDENATALAPAEQPQASLIPPPGFEERPPSLLVCSLTGRAGKTSVVATLGQTLSMMGEKVLLVHTSAGSPLAGYFGSREGRPGVVRTLSPLPGLSGSAEEKRRVPVQLVNLEAERFPRFDSGQDWLLGKLIAESRGRSRILMDVGTAGPEVGRLLSLRPVILVPIRAGVDSLASVQSVEAWFSQLGASPAKTNGHGPRLFYLLNQFDYSAEHHKELREALQVRLGSRLLPFVVSNDSLVQDALDQGETVTDYAPDSPVAEEFRSLATWLRGLHPAGVRVGA